MCVCVCVCVREREREKRGVCVSDALKCVIYYDRRCNESTFLRSFQFGAFETQKLRQDNKHLRQLAQEKGSQIGEKLSLRRVRLFKHKWL